MSISSASFTVPGEIIGVAVGALRIEPRYQRPLDSRRVRHMAEHLDASQLGVIEVHRRPDSSLVVLDGQHRARAVLDSRGPDAVVMAHVVEGLTVAQEAERFLALNRERVALTGYALWRARLAAGDPVVGEVEVVVKEAGLRTGQDEQDGVIRAVSALEAVLKAHGPDVLRDTLALVVAAFGRGSEAFRGDVLRGVAVVLDVYGDAGSLSAGLDNDLLARKLNTVTATQLVARAQAARAVQSGTLTRLIAQSVVTLYNKNRREHRLPDLPIRVRTAGRSVARRRNGVPAPTVPLEAEQATIPVGDGLTA